MSSVAQWTFNYFYLVGDTVLYAGTTYKCILNNVSSSANDPTHATYWVGFSGGTGTGGNGIIVDTVGSVSTISTNIVNGANTIVQYNSDKSIQINAPSPPTNVIAVIPGEYILVDDTDAKLPVVSVNAGAGLGGSAGELPSLVVLAGDGITVTGEGVSVNAGGGLTISEGALAVDYGNGLTIGENKLQNTGILSVGVGTGLSSTGGQNPVISNGGVLSVGVGTGLSSTGGQTPVISNSGIISVGVGSGLTSTGGQNPTITNSGVISVVAGTGITSTGGQNPTIANSGILGIAVNSPLTKTGTQTATLGISVGTGLSTTGGQLTNIGVLDLTAGTGLSSTGGQTPVISNSGIISVGVGSGLTSTGGQNPTITNSGVISVVAGTGITSTGGQNPTIANSGIVGLGVGAGLFSTGGNDPVISNDGVLDLTAGTGITITGGRSNYRISAPTPTIYTATYYTTDTQTITGGHSFNSNLVWKAEKYSTPTSMSLVTQSGGGSSFATWKCPITGVWSISLSVTINYTTTPSFIVMIEYNNSTKYYLPNINVVEGINLSGANSSSVTGTNILTAGSYYVISTAPASTVDVTFNPFCVWTLTYLGPSP